ncbi:hypothetical protein tb265_33910 [Gemmatimonadetes bacterium T265]|nr:hypothetical protein tb265_33910 [Gemmatimonadetes bacterium T265]
MPLLPSASLTSPPAVVARVAAVASGGRTSTTARTAAADVVGTVRDSASGRTLEAAEVSAQRDGQVVANAQTDAFGRYTLHNLAAGRYVVTARFIGFRAEQRTVDVGAAGGTLRGIDFALTAVAASLSAVNVTGTAPVAVDTRTGNQTFQQDNYKGAPTNTTSQILQQTIAGAARAPTGEVHIRGQHAEYTYYIDGVPVPAGISGSLNELFDPQVVNKIDFITGGWDAEYGNKNAAVVNVATRIPAGGFHLDLGTYAGAYSHADLNGPSGLNGQSVSASTNSGKWGFYFAGTRQSTGMRREPLVFDTARGQILNFHNDGTDLFGFGKVQYTPGSNDVVNLDANLSTTRFAVPYDSTGNIFNNDRQTDRNSFVNLSWRHQFGPGGASATSTGAANTSTSGEGAASDFFGGVYYRHGSLAYDPGANDSAQFVFAPDTTRYNLREQRTFNSYGLVAAYTVHPQRELEFKVGTQSSITRGSEAFSAFNSTTQGPASNSGLRGSDVGVYAQTAYAPVEWFELRTGARYDAHTAPFAGTQRQLSPRVRLNFFPTSATTLYAYYGRLFVPTNVEDLRAITSSALGSAVTPVPTLPERDNFYELGAVQRIPALGTTLKLAGFHKESTPGIDDNTIPGSAIVTSVNIARVRVTGIETAIEVRPSGPFSGYVNAALNHAYGLGPVTGGFFPTVPPSGYFDLDHDQRLSITANGYYAAHSFFVSATGIYGSGLTNGRDPAACGCSYGTGLFDFNSGVKVRPSAIFNLSTGYTFSRGQTVVTPQLYIENLFDKTYLLKGAFFSGASVGRPRSIQLRLNVGI